MLYVNFSGTVVYSRHEEGSRSHLQVLATIDPPPTYNMVREMAQQATLACE
jgi:hypothetical protein